MKTFDPSMPVTESVKHACYGPGEEEDVKAAALLKIKVTPTLFLDRRRLNPLQWGSTPFWRRIAADLLPEEEDANRQTGE